MIKFIKKVLASYHTKQAQVRRDNHNRKQFRLAHEGLNERDF